MPNDKAVGHPVRVVTGFEPRPEGGIVVLARTLHESLSWPQMSKKIAQFPLDILCERSVTGAIEPLGFDRKLSSLPRQRRPAKRLSL